MKIKKILAAANNNTVSGNPSSIKELGEYTFESLREEVHVIKLKHIPRKLIQRKMILTGREKEGPVSVVLLPNVPNIKTLAAAAAAGQGVGGPGQSTASIRTKELQEKYPKYFIHRPIPSINIREMTDPYNGLTRKMFTDCARTDPTGSSALRKRNNAFFRNGFHLKLRLKSQRSQIDGHILTEEEQDAMTTVYYQTYIAILNQLDSWCNNKEIKLKAKIKTAHYVGVVQGRFLTKHFPPMAYLEPGELPITLKVISAEEMGNVVIDRMTEEIIAVRIYSVDEENFVLLPDEFVYGFLNDSALTRYERFYGRSDMEAVTQISRINKHITNVGYAKAFEAAYMPKILSQLEVEGNPTEKMQQLKDHANFLTESGTDVIAIEAGENSNIQAMPQEVNHEMVVAIRKDIDEVMLGALGSTKAQISRTENLTRDNATIMEIENKRNVITPDENTFAEFFEQQLLNPLFCHLAGVPADNLPVEIYIEAIPDEEDILEKLDEKKADEEGDGGPGQQQQQQGQGPEPGQMRLEQQKENEINSESYRQDDAISDYGASAAAAGTRKFNEADHKRDKGKFARKAGSSSSKDTKDTKKKAKDSSSDTSGGPVEISDVINHGDNIFSFTERFDGNEIQMSQINPYVDRYSVIMNYLKEHNKTTVFDTPVYEPNGRTDEIDPVIYDPDFAEPFEQAMAKYVGVLDKPKRGSMFLGRDGTWYGAEEPHGLRHQVIVVDNHADIISETVSHAGLIVKYGMTTKYIDKDDEVRYSNERVHAGKAGMLRINNHTSSLNIQAFGKSITPSQRRELKDLIIETGMDPIYVNFEGSSDYFNERTVLRSLSAAGTRKFNEADHKRDKGKFARKEGSKGSQDDDNNNSRSNRSNNKSIPMPEVKIKYLIDSGVGLIAKDAVAETRAYVKALQHQIRIEDSSIINAIDGKYELSSIHDTSNMPKSISMYNTLKRGLPVVHIDDQEKYWNAWKELESEAYRGSAIDELPTTDVTAQMKQTLEKTKTLYRGTDIDRTMEMLRTGVLDGVMPGQVDYNYSAGDKRDFVSTTLSYDYAREFAGDHDHPVIVRYDTTDMKPDVDYHIMDYQIKPDLHVWDPARLGNEVIGNPTYRPDEKFGGSHSANFSNELEVQLKRGITPKISKIIIPQFEDNSGLFPKDEDTEWKQSQMVRLARSKGIPVIYGEEAGSKQYTIKKGNLP